MKQITCPHCGDIYPEFDVAHVCSKGPYAPRLKPKMNQRIYELASELGPVATIGNWGRVEWADNVYPQLGDRMHASIDLEKFAKLIAKDCADLCDKFQARNVGMQPAECAGAIRNMFGVEE